MQAGNFTNQGNQGDDTGAVVLRRRFRRDTPMKTVVEVIGVSRSNLAEWQASPTPRFAVRADPEDAPWVSSAARKARASTSRFEVDQGRGARRLGTRSAYFRMTPRRYPSGEVDHVGRISKCGDGMCAALCSRPPKSCSAGQHDQARLKTWGEALGKRIGAKKATMALACKLAVVLYRMWTTGTTFQRNAEAEAKSPAAPIRALANARYARMIGQLLVNGIAGKPANGDITLSLAH